MTRASEQERADAIDELRGILNPGDTVFTILRHVSRSGMSRRIDVYVIRNNEPRRLSSWVARAIGDRYHVDDGIIVNGAGMDMGFAVVYALGRALWPKGTASETDGGYALQQRWL